AVAVGALTIRQTDPVLVAAAILVMVIGLAPVYLWLLGMREGLPIWPAFSLYACTLAAMPALQKAQALERFPDSAILQSLLTMAGFFLVGSLIWYSLTAESGKAPRKILMLESDTAVRSLLWCIAAGVFFQVNSLTGWIQLPGNTMQIARGVSGGLSFLGIFAMAYFHGRGMLSGAQIATYILLTIALLLTALSSLLIANIVQPLALGAIGYTLGAGRPPWAAAVGLFAIVAILHSGKYSMRDIYLTNPDGAPRITLTSLPSFYSQWVSFGVTELGGIGGVFRSEVRDDSPTTVFERSGNLHMLVLVQHLSPAQVPFQGGITYEPIPQMLIPRFLMPNKAISHAGNIMLSINYGLSDEDSIRNVSIGWPLIAEAYANFGYIGVFAMSILLSTGYAFATRLSSQVPITSFRFVVGLVIMAGITNENTLGVFIGSQFQAIVGVAMASFFLMRRQPNPFYVGSGEASGIRQEADGVWQRDTAAAPATGPAKWGGHKPPKWAPLSHRKAFELAAARREAEAAAGENQEKNETGEKVARPRQVAVPIQPYYYRSRKA
ncbi:MAG: hypothetical protein ACKOEG_09915, partial [Chthoniobacterales bacterium]